MADGSILNVGEFRTPGSHRIVRHRFAFTPWNVDLYPGLISPKATTDDESNWSHYSNAAFGSYHTGVCNFVLGDGSVQAFSVTMDNEMLGAWGGVKDGKAVSL